MIQLTVVVNFNKIPKMIPIHDPIKVIEFDKTIYKTKEQVAYYSKCIKMVEF